LSFLSCARRLQRGRKDLAQFSVLFDHPVEKTWLYHPALLNYAKPDFGFVQFLQNNAELVNEIPVAFAASRPHRSLAPEKFLI